MNGRCETDPLDRAVDVCDSCYGEFCQQCLIQPRGRRHPLCTDCALALSGVRGHVSPQVRGDRRTAKERRTELKASAAQDDEQVFRFFDADQAAFEPQAVGQRGRRKRGKSIHPSTPAPASAAPTEVSDAVTALGTAAGVPGAADLPTAGAMASSADSHAPAGDRRRGPAGPPDRAEGSAAVPDGTDPTAPGDDPAPPDPARPATIDGSHPGAATAAGGSPSPRATPAVARLEQLRRQSHDPAQVRHDEGAVEGGGPDRGRDEGQGHSGGSGGGDRRAWLDNDRRHHVVDPHGPVESNGHDDQVGSAPRRHQPTANELSPANDLAARLGRPGAGAGSTPRSTRPRPAAEAVDRRAGGDSPGDPGAAGPNQPSAAVTTMARCAQLSGGPPTVLSGLNRSGRQRRP